MNRYLRINIHEVSPWCVQAWLVSAMDGSRSSSITIDPKHKQQQKKQSIENVVTLCMGSMDWMEYISIENMGPEPWMLCLDAKHPTYRIGSVTLFFSMDDHHISSGCFLSMDVVDVGSKARVEHDELIVDDQYVPCHGSATLSTHPLTLERIVGCTPSLFFEGNQRLLSLWPFAITARTCAALPRLCALLDAYPYTNPNDAVVTLYRSLPKKDVRCLILDIHGNESADSVSLKEWSIWCSVRAPIEMDMVATTFPSETDAIVYKKTQGKLMFSHRLQNRSFLEKKVTPEYIKIGWYESFT